MNLRISKNIIAGMIQHARRDFPFECCGFLFGEEGQQRHVRDFLAVPNSREGDQRRRFHIAPTDYLRAEQWADQHQTTLLGVYHSHPLHPAIASEHDLRQAVPFFSYVILSVYEDHVAELRSFRLREEAHLFDEESITF